jgi:hypothetical protein
MSATVTAQEVRRFQKHAQERTCGNLSTGQLVETWRKGDEMLFRYTFRVTEENNPFSKLIEREG